MKIDWNQKIIDHSDNFFMEYLLLSSTLIQWFYESNCVCNNECVHCTVLFSYETDNIYSISRNTVN